jgi:hypothetical protein
MARKLDTVKLVDQFDTFINDPRNRNQWIKNGPLDMYLVKYHQRSPFYLGCGNINLKPEAQGKKLGHFIVGCMVGCCVKYNLAGVMFYTVHDERLRHILQKAKFEERRPAEFFLDKENIVPGWETLHNAMVGKEV